MATIIWRGSLPAALAMAGSMLTGALSSAGADMLEASCHRGRTGATLFGVRIAANGDILVERSDAEGQPVWVRTGNAGRERARWHRALDAVHFERLDHPFGRNRKKDLSMCFLERIRNGRTHHVSFRPSRPDEPAASPATPAIASVFKALREHREPE
jgi:hypothetical protein